MITSKELIDLGYKPGPALGKALQWANEKEEKFHDKNILVTLLKALLDNPSLFLSEPDTRFTEIAILLLPKIKEDNSYSLNENSCELNICGLENIEEGALKQINIASKLPISKKAFLAPDAHQGYGLPIGGVLATKNSIIPYGVGVDIGCRMALTIYDIKTSYIDGQKDKLKKSIEECTAFGAGIGVKTPLQNDIFDRKEFSEIEICKKLQGKAIIQIGSSGSGNHFVEYGIVEITDINNEFNLPLGNYVGILTHSGSRGFGAGVAKHYTDIAMDKCKLPQEAKHLAWLDLDKQEGQEYWLAMNLAGDYASACHSHIHKALAKYMGWKEVGRIENHHNFAWKEIIDGEELIIHRKGATPAGKGVLGIIPGSMATPGFLVRGKGNTDSINSASHGAGRLLSRTKANNSITMSSLKKVLEDNKVILIGGNVDEAPAAYKDIHKVMASQTHLIDVIGKFQPRIVRMDKDKGDI